MNFYFMAKNYQEQTHVKVVNTYCNNKNLIALEVYLIGNFKLDILKQFENFGELTYIL